MQILAGNNTGQPVLPTDPLTILVIGYVLGLATTGMAWLVSRFRTARWNHRQAVLTAIGEQLESDHASTYDGRSLYVAEIRWNQSDPRSTELRRHLESPRYRSVLSKFELAKKARDRAEGELANAIRTLEKAIPNELGSRWGLQVWSGHTGVRNYWDPVSVRKILFQDARSIVDGGSFPKPEIESQENYDQSPSEKSFVVTINHSRVGEGTEGQMVDLRAELVGLLRSDSVMGAARAFSEAETARTKDSSKADFERVRSSVHDSLEFGQKELKGSCDFCPSYFGIEVQPRGGH